MKNEVIELSKETTQGCLCFECKEHVQEKLKTTMALDMFLLQDLCHVNISNLTPSQIVRVKATTEMIKCH